MTLIDVLCSNLVKSGLWEIIEIVHCLRDKKNNKISPGFPAIATAQITPKICQGQPLSMYTECCRFHPNQFTFGSVIAEHVKAAKRAVK